ncbi:hypothetical protein Anas_12205 [Armadillidium nasatum]|uniref:Uncharacterized protein n=1 Tax=Armadillidium nasatum TaxID=96803 RepID=A0A5N5SNR8_9CRUS|nr:hypothetical protein Anas_12205 [Armadillidium nasatum]
MISRLNLNVL